MFTLAGGNIFWRIEIPAQKKRREETLGTRLAHLTGERSENNEKTRNPNQRFSKNDRPYR